MVKKSVRMASVVKIAESDEQKAARALGECQQQLEMCHQRLEQLQDYRSEYLSVFNEKAGGGISITQMQRFRAFISQLDNGIEEQQRVIGGVQLEVEQKRQEWFGKRTKTKAMDKVVEQHRYQEQLIAGKRDQKESDERAQVMRCGMVAFE